METPQKPFFPDLLILSSREDKSYLQSNGMLDSGHI